MIKSPASWPGAFSSFLSANPQGSKASFKGFLLKGSKVSIRVYRVPFKGIYKGCFKRIYREYYEGSTGVTRGLCRGTLRALSFHSFLSAK